MLHPSLRNLQPLMYLAMVNPVETSGIHLVNKCDEWVCAERQLCAGEPTGPLLFQDIEAAVTEIVGKILARMETEYVADGMSLTAVIDELDRAGYSLTVTKSMGRSGMGIYYLLHQDKVLLSDYIRLPLHVAARIIN